jgi:hypothetical protein
MIPCVIRGKEERGIRLLIGGLCSHEAVRQSVLKEGKLLLENQEKKLRQIENLDYGIKRPLILPI